MRRKLVTAAGIVLAGAAGLGGTAGPAAAQSEEEIEAREIAAVGTVLAAAYLLWLYQRTAFGEPNPEFVGDAHRSGPVGDAHLAHSVGAAANPHDDAAFWAPAPLLARLAGEGKTFS